MTKVKRFCKVSWLKTIYFNLHYLPFKQAIKLPIYLYKPKLIECKGSIRIESDNIWPGMVRLGILGAAIFPDNGIIWENHGGTVTFRGQCTIGNDSALSVGECGNIDFGSNFISTARMRIISLCSIEFLENTRCAWETLLMDTSFHKLKDMNGHTIGTTTAPIHIGKNNWITSRCTILKGAKTPDYCVTGTGSIVNKDYSNLPTHILLAGSPLEVKAQGIWRDIEDDAIA
jgi:acetyltransferase-like isoleucine patch superfamily enzyme